MYLFESTLVYPFTEYPWDLIIYSQLNYHGHLYHIYCLIKNNFIKYFRHLSLFQPIFFTTLVL